MLGGGVVPAKLVGNLPFREREPVRGDMSCWRRPTTKPPGESQGKLLTEALQAPDPGEAAPRQERGAGSGRSPHAAGGCPPAHRSQETQSLPPVRSPRGPCPQSLTCCQEAKGKCFKSPAQLSYSGQERAHLELRDNTLVTGTFHPAGYLTSFSALHVLQFRRSNKATLHVPADEIQLHLLHARRSAYPPPERRTCTGPAVIV